jgi:proteic killer suppression protein
MLFPFIENPDAFVTYRVAVWPKIGYSIRAADGSPSMIKRFKHKGLKQLYRKGDRAAFAAHDSRRLRNILARMDEAANPKEMDLPGLNLYSLRGRRKDTWMVTVRANFRVTWKAGDDGGFIEIDYEDYH